MKMEGAIFDLDGTLLDSMFIWDTIGGDYLRRRGIEPGTDIDEVFKAMSLQTAAAYYKREYGVADSVEEIVAGVNRMVESLYRESVPPKPGAADFLAELYRRNIPLCVATATDRYLAEAALSRCGLLKFFKGIVTCAEVCSDKNSPEIFEAALKILGTPKDSTVVFEDAVHAVRTAKKAGFPVVAVYDPSFSFFETAIRKLADVYIKSFAEMGDYLD